MPERDEALAAEEAKQTDAALKALAALESLVDAVLVLDAAE